MTNIHHPSTIIEPVLYGTLREFAADAELLGRLHDDQLSIIYQQRWFNFFVPERFGGLGLSLPEALRLEEALAWTDGSVGWTVTLCSGANWFAGFLADSARNVLFDNRKACLAGSGKPSGVAQITDAGYLVSGEWNYATGAMHATAFTTNCIIEKDGTPLQDAAGNPLIQSFWFYTDEVSLRKNWHTIGMIATGSHGFSIKDVLVPFDRSFVLEPGKAVLPDPVFHFPFLQFAEATLAVNYSGMAVRFLDLCAVIFEEKLQRPSHRFLAEAPLRKMLHNAVGELETARLHFYTAIDKAWDSMTATGSVPAGMLADMSHTSRHMATIAREKVDALYPFCGIAAADPTTSISRVWRDLHTASQHALLTFPAS
ncbi:acyl-CoA dehydrogenase [Paraflavitalea sp. CAU 1676]|uniref:acyl-CoA dehydrogenase n=1 Tax=Paraflavitalea sp. CAU 1676 TaxID=3032598 RepID=UPI0023DA53E8|nr:acyl-CoA dehydrogenase [Paraflavitalea sp. CAU 1676]MDF2192406.1 acyl-CoA dehydrogenase [Paraflavitalea sp. CAU 1676]